MDLDFVDRFPLISFCEGSDYFDSDLQRLLFYCGFFRQRSLDASFFGFGFFLIMLSRGFFFIVWVITITFRRVACRLLNFSILVPVIPIFAFLQL